MRLVVTIVAALMILGLAALGLDLGQKGITPIATAGSTLNIASATQEVPALPAGAPVSQIGQAAGPETSLLILQTVVDAQIGSPMTTGMQATLAASAAAPKVNDQNFGLSAISKAMVHETTRLKDDATGWAQKLQKLELDLKLQELELGENQDVEAKGKDIDECLVVLRAAAGRLAPDAETEVALRTEEVAVRDLAIRAEVHSDPEIRKTAGYFQRKSTELHALNRSVEEIRTRLVTQIDRLEELKIRLEFNRTAAQIGEAVKGGDVNFENIQAITAEAQRIAADLDLHRVPNPNQPLSEPTAPVATPNQRTTEALSAPVAPPTTTPNPQLIAEPEIRAATAVQPANAEPVDGRDQALLAAMTGSERKVAEIPIEHIGRRQLLAISDNPLGGSGSNGRGYYVGGPNIFTRLFGGLFSQPAQVQRRQVAQPRPYQYTGQAKISDALQNPSSGLRGSAHGSRPLTKSNMTPSTGP
jgi:hypothetical protein